MKNIAQNIPNIWYAITLIWVFQISGFRRIFATEIKQE